VLGYIEKNYLDSLQRGVVFIDPDGRLDGYIVFYEGRIDDGTGAIAGKRLLGFYISGDDVKPISPSIIWDLAPANDAVGEAVDIDLIKNTADRHVIESLVDYRKELLSERIKQAEIKKKYGVESLKHLIVSLDGDLIALKARKERGENVDLAIRNKEDRKSSYEKALEKLKDQIEKEKSLTMAAPRFLGVIRVVTDKRQDEEMRADFELEEMGMQIAIEYEKAQGRVPEDVSDQNLGFDIRSKDPEVGTIRYIEVKARADTGPVSLTLNEWFKANRFKDDYYLYAVMEISTGNPELYIIQNPAENLKAEEVVDVVRYSIPFSEIKEKGLVEDGGY
ncbi:MAG: helicase, partial [Candidatus Methanomethylicota archaeon]